MDQAVVKFMRGPTSRIKLGCPFGRLAHEAFVGELLRLEGLCKKPAEQAHLVLCERARRSYVEAELGCYPVNRGRNLLLCKREQTRGLVHGQCRRAKKMKNSHNDLNFLPWI